MNHPIFILGASGGVGSSLTRILSARGADLHLFGRDTERLAELAEEVGGADTTPVDVMDGQGLTEAIRSAAEPLDGIAGLAYCVGSIDLKPLKRATEEDFLSAFRLNALGAALAVQAAEPGLRKGKGAVVFFSTIAAEFGFANHAVTAAAKGAVEGLTRSLAADLAPAVRVNCIAPSLLNTPLARPLTSNETMADSIAKLHPLPRLGEAEDAGALAAFLLGPESEWITGQVIALDGGRSRVRIKG